jgi:perosamine synthetase
MTTTTVSADAKYNGNESSYVLEYLDSENLSNKRQPWVGRFEAKFREVMGVQYAIAHNSGTSTLHSCLEAADVGFGDEVIMPAQTVAMLAFVTIAQNAIPVFADLDPDTFNLSAAEVKRLITPQTKAIIAVHMHGAPADMDPIIEVAREHGITLIEDCAQSLLATYKGKLAGTMGDLASFSFETKKHVSTGEGGMVTTNDERLGTAVRKFGGLGYKTLKAGAGLRALLPEEFQNPHYKRHDTHGLNYRMPDLCGALGLAQLERVDFLVKRRQQVAQYFLEALDQCSWIVPQRVLPGCQSTYWTFTVKYDGLEARGVSWEQFYKAYKANGGDGFYGGLSVTYMEPFMQNKTFLRRRLPAEHPAFKGKFEYPVGLCPVAESVQPRMMQFKTNYRNLETAKRQAGILKNTILQFRESRS